MTPTRSPKVRMSFLKFQASPEFIKSAAYGLVVAIIFGLFSRVIQNTLKFEVVSFYVMGLIALTCLILVVHLLIRIQQLVENRNHTRFITSKTERLTLMTEYIKRARKSIYILSDLSNPEETQLQEHERYLEALNQVIKANMANSKFDFMRIVVPSKSLGKNIDSDPNWIHNVPIDEAYRKHFELLKAFDEICLKYKDGPRNVSIMLIDNKYLFWKPEIAFEEKALDRILDGGIYLEDYSAEGMTEFSECFRIMHGKALSLQIEPENFDPTKPQK